MSRSEPSADHFVAGGALQPGRACYVVRAADRHLLQALREQRSAYVFGPRHVGKTSLMLATARQLRDDGWRTAIVDLTQIGAREGPRDAGRWFYSLAYRLVRELRIRAPLQAWWQERAGLTVSQRLLEFFRELVLGGTGDRVVVFIDDLDCAEALPFAGDFLASLRACLNARATDPEFRRLSFVLLGVTTPGRLAPDPNLGPFAVSEAVTLDDFTLPETLQLAGGLPGGEERARALLERVHHWTAGQPYLTQKVCRSLARAEPPVTDADGVDRLLRDRLLNPAAARGEPMLNHIATRLHDGDRRRTRLLSLYGRVRKGLKVDADPNSALQERLRLLGLVVEDQAGQLRVRNRVYAAVFTTRWVNQQLPMDWRGLGVAAGMALVLIGLPLWYLQYMPRADMAVLSADAAGDEAVMAAYRRLRARPGHAATAERLLAGVLERRSRRAGSFDEVREMHATLSALAGRQAEADALLADYWRRRMRAAEAAGQRDEALAAALAGAGLDNALNDDLRRLVGEDYPLLQATLRPDDGIAAWALTAEGFVVGGLSGRVQQYGHDGSVLDSGFDAHAIAYRSAEVTVDIDGGGQADTVEIALALDDGMPAGLLLSVEAPDGARFALSPRSEGNGEWSARIEPSQPPGMQGTWRLRLASADTDAGAHWSAVGLALDGAVAERRDVGLELAPARPLQGEVLVSADGGLVAAVPSYGTGATAVALWSVGDRRAGAWVAIPGELVQSGLALSGRRLLLRDGEGLTLADTSDGTVLARVPVVAENLIDTVLSHDQSQLALLEADGRGGSAVRVIDLDSGDTVAAFDHRQPSTALAVHDDGTVVLAGRDRVLRSFDARYGTLIGESQLAADVGWLSVDGQGDWVAALKLDDTVAWYRLPGLGAPRQRLRVGGTADWRGTPFDLDGSGRIASVTPGGRIQLYRLADGAALLPPLRHADQSTGMRLLDDLLVTYDGRRLRAWRLDGPAAPSPRRTALSAVNLGPDGRDALLGYWDGRVAIQPAAELAADLAGTAALAIDYLGHTAPIRTLQMSHGRTRVASGSDDGVIRLWSTLTGEPLPHFLRHPDGDLRALVFAPDDTHLLSVGTGGALLWRLDDGEPVRRFSTPGTPVVAAFDDGGARVAVADTAGSVLVWRLDAPEADPQLLRGDAAVTALAFMDNGALVSGDRGGRLQLWDTTEGARLGDAVRLSGQPRTLLRIGEGQLVAVTRDWVHRIAVHPQRLRHRHGRFVWAELQPATVRLEDGAGEPVGLGRYDRPVPVYPQRGPSADGPDDALTQRPWTRLLARPPE